MGLFDTIQWESNMEIPHAEPPADGRPPSFQTKSFDDCCLRAFRVTSKNKLEHMQSQKFFFANTEKKGEVNEDWEHYWVPFKFDGVIDAIADNFVSDRRYLIKFNDGKLTKIDSYKIGSKELITTVTVLFRPVNKMIQEDFEWKELNLKRKYAYEQIEKLMVRLCNKWPFHQFTYSIKSDFVE